MQNNLNINISSGYDLDDTKATRITELTMTCLNLFIYFRLMEIDHHYFRKSEFLGFLSDPVAYLY